MADDDDKDRLNRELIELLNELRVALPGVQVLFAFLLAVPFAQRFGQITTTQKNVYFASVLTVAAATAFLIAPSAYHRLQFRAQDKERMLLTSNHFAIVGMIFLAASIALVVWLITDVLFGGGWTPLVTTGVALLFAWLWYGLPLLRRARGSD